MILDIYVCCFFCILYCSLCLSFMLYFFGLVDVVVVNFIVIG